jgi:hypothetical protein
VYTEQQQIEGLSFYRDRQSLSGKFQLLDLVWASGLKTSASIIESPSLRILVKTMNTASDEESVRLQKLQATFNLALKSTLDKLKYDQ